MMSSFTETQVKRALVVLGAIAAVAIFGSWLAYSVYVARSDQSAVRRLGAFLPVAKVGARIISYGEFLGARDALKAYLAASAATQGTAPVPLTPDIEEGAYQRLLREAVVDEAARGKGITVSDQDVAVAYNGLLTVTSSTPEALATFIKQSFNWSETEFRNEMLRPQLLEERVSAELTASTSTSDRQAAVSAFADQRLAKPDVRRYLRFPAPPLASP